MDQIYSETVLIGSGLALGEWKFSLSKDKINERISSFCSRAYVSDSEEERLASLFSILKQPSKVNQTVLEMSMTGVEEETAPERSTVCDDDKNEEMKENDLELVQELSSLVVDVCNRLVPKLKLDHSIVRVESELLISDLNKLSKDTLISIMRNAWYQIQSDESKLCFCVIFSSTTIMSQCLCKHILFSWLKGNQFRKLELLSSILCKEGETVCLLLVAPLLQTENSPWIRDLPAAEELMSAMNAHHWTILLKELVSDLNDLQEWQIPALSTVVRKAEPSYQELRLLVQLMTTTSTKFAQNRDFGALVAGVASSLKPDSASLGPQLKAIVNNFKGSLKVMKFKTLKIIADSTD